MMHRKGEASLLSLRRSRISVLFQLETVEILKRVSEIARYREVL